MNSVGHKVLLKYPSGPTYVWPFRFRRAVWAKSAARVDAHTFESEIVMIILWLEHTRNRKKNKITRTRFENV